MITQQTSVMDAQSTSAADLMQIFASIVSSGVVPGAGRGLQVYADSSGMQVKLNTGIAFVGSYEGPLIRRMYRLSRASGDPDLVLPVSSSANIPAGQSRIDRVVLRLDLTQGQNKVYPAVVAGDPSASPTPPALQRSGNIWELGLATVSVASGAQTITAGDVADTRADYTPVAPDNVPVCGWAFGRATSLMDGTDYNRRVVPVLDESRSLNARWMPLTRDLPYNSTSTSTANQPVATWAVYTGDNVQRTVTLKIRVSLSSNNAAGVATAALIDRAAGDAQLASVSVAGTVLGVMWLTATLTVNPGERRRIGLALKTNNASYTTSCSYDDLHQSN